MARFVVLFLILTLYSLNSAINVQARTHYFTDSSIQAINSAVDESQLSTRIHTKKNRIDAAQSGTVKRQALSHFNMGRFADLSKLASRIDSLSGVSRSDISITNELAGLLALQRGETQQAITFFQRATDHVGDRQTAAQVNLFRSLAISLNRHGAYRAAEQSIAEASRRLSAMMSSNPDLDLLSLQADIYETASYVHLGEHLTAVAQIRPSAQSDAFPVVPVIATRLSVSATSPSALQRSHAYLDSMANVIDQMPTGPQRTVHEIDIEVQRAGFAVASGDLETANRILTPFLQDDRALSPWKRTLVAYFAALSAALGGDLDRAAVLVDRARDSAQRYDQPFFLSELHVVAVYIAARQGDSERATEAMQAIAAPGQLATAYTLQRATRMYMSRFSRPPTNWMPWILVGFMIAGHLLHFAGPRRFVERLFARFAPPFPFAPYGHSRRGNGHGSEGIDSGPADPDPAPSSSDSDADASVSGTESRRTARGTEMPPVFPPRTRTSPTNASGGDGHHALPDGYPAIRLGQKRARWPFGTPTSGSTQLPYAPGDASPLAAPPHDISRGAGLQRTAGLLPPMRHSFPAYDRSGAFCGLKQMPAYLVSDMIQHRFYILDLDTRFGVIYRLASGSHEVISRDGNHLNLHTLPYACHGLPIYWMRPA